MMMLYESRASQGRQRHRQKFGPKVLCLLKTLTTAAHRWYTLGKRCSCGASLLGTAGTVGAENAARAMTPTLRNPGGGATCPLYRTWGASLSLQPALPPTTPWQPAPFRSRRLRHLA